MAKRISVLQKGSKGLSGRLYMPTSNGETVSTDSLATDNIQRRKIIDRRKCTLIINMYADVVRQDQSKVKFIANWYNSL